MNVSYKSVTNITVFKVQSIQFETAHTIFSSPAIDNDQLY